jgi:hypothetical protein
VRPSAQRSVTRQPCEHASPNVSTGMASLDWALWFDMYVEDDYAAFVRYCFEDPLDAEIFRARFEPKIEHLKLAG